jgi:hypothetical protein
MALILLLVYIDGEGNSQKVRKTGDWVRRRASRFVEAKWVRPLRFEGIEGWDQGV